jgi:hypothetical protein
MTSVRGSALVRQVLADLPVHRWRANREPLGPRVVSSLRCSSGESIPESLAAWLEFDAISPSGDLALVRETQLATRSMQQILEATIVAESVGEDWESDTRDAMNELAAGFPGDVLLLREPTGQDLILYLSARDESGECPVLAIEHEQIWVAYPGFDFYVAHEVGEHDVRLRAGYATLIEHATKRCGLQLE